MAGLVFFQRTAERVAQRRLQLRVIVLLLDEFIHAQRFADDLILRQVAAALHFPADEFFLMRREQNFHGGKLKGGSRPVKKFLERAGLKWWAQKYVDNGAYCLKHGIGVGQPVKS
jgi:hypothetical protein